MNPNQCNIDIREALITVITSSPWLDSLHIDFVLLVLSLLHMDCNMSVYRRFQTPNDILTMYPTIWLPHYRKSIRYLNITVYSWFWSHSWKTTFQQDCFLLLYLHHVNFIWFVFKNKIKSRIYFFLPSMCFNIILNIYHPWQW